MKTLLVINFAIFPLIVSHIHHHHHAGPHSPGFFPFPGFPLFPIEKCELLQNYTNILNNYERYYEGNMRVFYLAHRNKNNEPQCYSKLKKVIDSFNNNIFLTSKKFTFQCPKSNDQKEKILTLKLCFTEEEEKIMQMPDDEIPTIETRSNTTEEPLVSEVIDVSEIFNTQFPIPSNQITLCFRLYGQKIENCLYDALVKIT